MEDIEYNDADQSEFDSGIAALMRCHEIKKWLHAAKLKDDNLFYAKHLKMYFAELRPMMKPEEREVHDENWKKLRLLERKIKQRETITQEEVWWLEDLELILRDIEQSKNMNIPKRRDARWGAARR